ncbi:MAG: ATP-binding protein [Desulfovibrionaceae bacterium]
MPAMYGYRIDYLLFSQGLCLFFIALFAVLLFRRHRALEWLWLCLMGIAIFLSTALHLIHLAVPNVDVLGKAGVSLQALSLFFLALYGANGLRPGRMRGGAYVLCGILLVIPTATALVNGAEGFATASTLCLGLVGGTLALSAMWRHVRSPDAIRYGASLYPLLACYVVVRALAPALQLLWHGIANNWDMTVAILPARTYAVAGAVAAAAAAISCARAAAFGREGPSEAIREGTLAYSFGLTSVGFALLLGFTLTDMLGDSAEESIRNELYMRVSAVGNALDPDEVHMLSGAPREVASSSYRRLLLQLGKIKNSNSDLRFIYMVGLSLPDRKLLFTLDTEPPTSTDYATPGTEYTEAPPELLAIFSQGKAQLVGPYSDRWGRWISGFAPVKDETGAILGVVGMDIAARNMEKSVAGMRLMGIIITFLLAVIGAGIGLIIERNAQLTIANVLLQEEILQRQNAEEALLQARHAAEAANRAKSEFLASMSHEIRTPMNTILGMTGLAMEAGKEERTEYLNAARESAQHLLALVDDVLDVSRIEAGKMDLECLDFDLEQLVDSVRTLMLVQARLKRLTLKTHIESGTPTQLQGDPTRLRQILVNLVGNAIKFTNHGQVEVRVATATPHVAAPPSEHTGQGTTLLFSVRDTGVGIAPDKANRVFDAFSQADGSITRRYGGSGLGLAICKHLTSLMGGRIWVESTPGQGSTFYFTACFHNGRGAAPSHARHPARPAASDDAPPPAGRLRVLLAEDTLANVRLAELYLNKLGHTCTVAGNGKKVLQALAAARFDVVLMDLEMPEMDGLEATRRIREGDGDKDIPIIAMTAHALDEFRDLCAESGMNDYLAKPISLHALDQALRRNARPAANADDQDIQA